MCESLSQNIIKYVLDYYEVFYTHLGIAIVKAIYDAHILIHYMNTHVLYFGNYQMEYHFHEACSV